jgi:hypothetical protein
VWGDDVSVSGGYAFLGGGSVFTPDVQVVELGVNATPSPLSTYTGLDYAYGIDTEGAVAYVLGTTGTNDWELRSLGMSVPSALQVLDSLPIIHEIHIRGMDVDGGTVVIALGDDLWLVDASTPAAMSVVSTTPLDCCVSDLKVDESYVYITRSDGLRRSPCLIDRFSSSTYRRHRPRLRLGMPAGRPRLF